jgi:WD40 repeat protein
MVCTHVATLSRHRAVINGVRWCPSTPSLSLTAEEAESIGDRAKEWELLASADDEGIVYLWAATIAVDAGGVTMAEEWRVIRHFSSGANASLYALAWSPCGSWISAGAVDGTVRVWTVPSFGVATIVRRTGGTVFGEEAPALAEGETPAPAQEALHWTLAVPSKSTARLAPVAAFSDHSHYVQGLAFDPRGELLASQAVDRTVRVYRLSASTSKRRGGGKKRTWELDTLIRNGAVVGAAEGTAEKPLFLGEHAGIGFFRRLTWTPDGAFLLVPAGVRRAVEDGETRTSFATHLFSRRALGRGPAASFLSPNAPTVAVRCNPVLFAPSSTTPSPTAPLAAPYRLIFAAATASQVAIYDSSLSHPLAVLSDQHYSSVTDLAWSPDGSRLLLSSTDGFITNVYFGDDMLGKPLSETERAQVAGMDKVGEVRVDEVQVRVKKPRGTKRKAAEAAAAASGGGEGETGAKAGKKSEDRQPRREEEEEEEEDDDDDDDDDEEEEEDDDDEEESAEVKPLGVRSVGSGSASGGTVHQVQVKRRIQLVPIADQ